MHGVEGRLDRVHQRINPVETRDDVGSQAHVAGGQFDAGVTAQQVVGVGQGCRHPLRVGPGGHRGIQKGEDLGGRGNGACARPGHDADDAAHGEDLTDRGEPRQWDPSI